MHLGKNAAFAAVVAILIALNLMILIQAYPETLKVDSGCCAPTGRLLAKDFSAYYTAAWRLFHDPSQMYTRGFVADGEYRMPNVSQPESFKYLPSFLIVFSPFSLLPYQSAFTAFDVFQFLLLPLMALMIYGITRGRSFGVKVVLAAIVLLLPIPLHAGEWSVSVSYYWQWAEGQSKVLEAFILVLMAYFARAERPRLSGVVFGLSFFDPRFSLLALPLFLGLNTRLRAAGAWALGAMAVTNIPLLYPGVWQGFVGMVLGEGLSTPMYYYSWIPLATVISLTAVNWEDIVLGFRKTLGGREGDT
jgi:hypothetical protein